MILLVTLSIAAGCRGADGRAGMYAGLAAACKATPLLFAPVFLWQRHFKAAAVLTATMAAATLLPDLLTPARDGRLWVVSWYTQCLQQIRPGDTAQAKGYRPKWNQLNQSLAGTLYRLSEPPGRDSGHSGVDIRLWSGGPRLRSAVTLGAQLAVLAVLGLATRPGRDTRRLAPDGAACAASARAGR